MPGKFVHRVRKQKAKARQNANNPTSDVSSDSNAAVIIPSSNEKRKTELRDQLTAHQDGLSSKKRKRLDHYIDTKLRKEENAELMKKLATQKVDTTLLRSSKNLGRGRDTKRETFSRALKETARGINVQQHSRVLFEERDSSPTGLSPTEPEIPVLQTNGTAAESKSFGSGLKRPLHVDQDGMPQIKVRKRRKVAKVNHNDHFPEDNDEEHSDEFNDDGEGEGEDEGDDSEANSSVGDLDEWNGFSGDEESDIGAAAAASDRERDTDTDSEAESDHESASDSFAQDDRTSVFKMWAEQQRNQALGFVPSQNNLARAQEEETKQASQFIPRPYYSVNAPALGPLTAGNAVSSIVVPRKEEIQEARLRLPVVQEEQRIMEAINANKITIVCGATGSGKTTQVPQMMFEAGHGSSIGQMKSDSTDKKTKGMIGVTQPRRVAATSVADRVATELGEMRNRVGHQVRFDSAVGPKTAIKFMTDGILINELSTDFALSKYSAIIIDEAHERSVNTDILIGLLSRIVDLREELSRENPDTHYPLKLVIMSATMRVQDFTDNELLFRAGAPPLVQAEGRLFPVTNHFARQTSRDYADDMFNKVSRGHRKLPRGAMLVFLTGQDEIINLMKRLQQTFSPVEPSARSTTNDNRGANHHHRSTMTRATEGNDDYIAGLTDSEDEEFEIEEQQDPAHQQQKVLILPLYSKLTAAQQAKVFQPPPENTRLIVLATNVAETSITIPGVRYVFDCGRVKEKQYDTRTGVQTFEVGWISKASAAQRAGRAGRTGPGHCYRLYSSAVYERDFEEYTIPEILRCPVENVALIIKSVDFPNVPKFPFPTPPDRHALARAEVLLHHLGAIGNDGKITQNGRLMVKFPVNPRLGRMLLFASCNDLMAHTIALISALAIPELLMTQNQVSPKPVITRNKDQESSEEEVELEQDTEKVRAYRKAQYTLSKWNDRSDAMKLFTAFAICAKSEKSGQVSDTCEDFFIHEKAMTEALSLRDQLVRMVGDLYPNMDSHKLTHLSKLDELGLKKLNDILAAGHSDQVAIREDLLVEVAPVPGRKPRRAIEVPYRTLLPSALSESVNGQVDKRVYIHPSSLLARVSVSDAPRFIIYSHLSKSAPKTIAAVPVEAKVRIHPLTTVTPQQLVGLLDGTDLFETGKPIGQVKVLPRREGKECREVWVGVHLRGDGVRWDLGTRKERQVRVKGDWKTAEVLG
ncbi:hypothetical protein ANO11243_017430 [Dothideomycetidae sp. 11243]|nr:hypothetical protein ANO11243_017430 [fungal sp. No.11243]